MVLGVLLSGVIPGEGDSQTGSLFRTKVLEGRSYFSYTERGEENTAVMGDVDVVRECMYVLERDSKAGWWVGMVLA